MVGSLLDLLRLSDLAVPIARVLLFLRVEWFDSPLVSLSLPMVQQQFPFTFCRAQQRILYFCELHVSLRFDCGRRHLGNVGSLTERGDIFGGLLLIDLHLLLQFVGRSRSRAYLRVDNHRRHYDVGALDYGSLRHAWHHYVHISVGGLSLLLLLITVLVLLVGHLLARDVHAGGEGGGVRDSGGRREHRVGSRSRHKVTLYMWSVLVGLQVNRHRLLLLRGNVMLLRTVSVLLLLLLQHFPLILLLPQLLPHIVVLLLVHLILALLLPDQHFLLQLRIDLVGLLKNVVQFLLCTYKLSDVDMVQVLITLIVSVFAFLAPVQYETSPFNDLLPLNIAHMHLHGEFVAKDDLD